MSKMVKLNKNGDVDLKDVEIKIKKYGVLTGSRAWNVHYSTSDYDYAIPQELYDSIANVLRGKRVLKKQTYMNGSNLKIDGKIYNIFPCSKAKLSRICTINDMFVAAQNQPKSSRIIQSKNRRVLLFETLDSILKYLGGGGN